MKVLLFCLLFLSLGVTKGRTTQNDTTALNNYFIVNKKILTEKLKNKQVILIGDATHGERAVMEFNIHFIKFLHEEMGYNTIAFESGLYDLYRAQKNIDEGEEVGEEITNSVFSIWASTDIFQELIQYIRNNKSEIQIIGFDSQFTGGYSTNDFVNDLKSLLNKHHKEEDIDYELLKKVFTNFGTIFDTKLSHEDFRTFGKNLKRITKCLKNIKGEGSEDLELWIQFIESTETMARDYYENHPGSVSPKEFKAYMSNNRDLQMAKNLLFHLSQHPNEKVVCWGASTHFANDLSSTKNKELLQYKPMGRHLKNQLEDRIFSYAPIIGSGEYGAFGEESNIGRLSENSIEYKLMKEGAPYQWIDLNNKGLFESYAIEHTRLSAEWSDVFDAFIYIPKTEPTSLANSSSNSDEDQEIEVTTTDNENHSIHIKGVVVDQNNKAIPFCNIGLKEELIGTVSYQDGHYELFMPKDIDTKTILFSCIGYTSRELPIDHIPETVVLKKEDRVLDEVMVQAKALDPKEILKKAIRNIPNNYIQEDYNIEIYSRGQLADANGLKVQSKLLALLYDKNGVNYKENMYVRQTQAAYDTIDFNYNIESYRSSACFVATATYFMPYFDLISTTHLLKKDQINRLKLKLSGTSKLDSQKVYKVDFERKYRYRYAEGLDVEKVIGTFFINASDYAVIKIDIHWEFNIPKINKFLNIMDTTTELSLYETITYKKHNEKYVIDSGRLVLQQKGICTKNGKSFDLKGWQTFFNIKTSVDHIQKIDSFEVFTSPKNIKSKDDKSWEKYHHLDHRKL
ncbi:erythromycin esterase family protein [Halosquirtibacter xylanolyticus]|uniref:erythromycin esterase family protein n=1 Tax=Halosquirtibacter xylanolyticus TaxID=3374599 RepID=UPI00374A77F0|nr:erythromycin esterase family protein [Prolixibacteraceae bacterium]